MDKLVYELKSEIELNRKQERVKRVLRLMTVTVGLGLGVGVWLAIDEGVGVVGAVLLILLSLFVIKMFNKLEKRYEKERGVYDIRESVIKVVEAVKEEEGIDKGSVQVSIDKQWRTKREGYTYYTAIVEDRGKQYEVYVSIETNEVGSIEQVYPDEEVQRLMG